MLTVIASMPRSGSTWLGKLFDSHDVTLYLHEPDSVLPRNDLPLLLDDASVDLQQAIQGWLAVKDDKVLASRPMFKKQARGAIKQHGFELTALAGKAALRFGLPSFGMPLFSRFHAEVTAWKTIESVGRMPALLRTEGIQGIHLIRHPCGQIASTLRGSEKAVFGSDLPVWEDEDLYKKLLEQGSYSALSLSDVMSMGPEGRLAVRWGLMNDFTYTRLKGSSRYQMVRYEDLCAGPFEIIKSLFDFCGLVLGAQTLRFLEESTGKHNDGYYSTSKDPLRAANSWRDQLSSSQQTAIMEVAHTFECGKLFEL